MQPAPGDGPLDRMWSRGRTTMRSRVARLRSKSFAIAQCALAAGIAWYVASDVFGHQTPFFAPIAAVVSLGTSYGQRLRRVAEVTIGVAVGVFLGDLLVYWLGSGAWQVSLVVALAMSMAFLLGGGPLLVTQAAVQSIVITTLIADPGPPSPAGPTPSIGGGIALVAATVVPAAPLRRPREQASEVLRKVSALLRAAADVMVDGEVDEALELLADARDTDYLIQELRAAADEGLDVVASSPFRVRHKGGLRRMVELVDPLDRSLRSTRVLVRHVAVAAYRRRPFPPSYPMVTRELAAAVDAVADELAADRMAVAAQRALLAVGMATAQVERSDALSVEVVLAQLRAVVADLLCSPAWGSWSRPTRCRRRAEPRACVGRPGTKPAWFGTTWSADRARRRPSRPKLRRDPPVRGRSESRSSATTRVHDRGEVAAGLGGDGALALVRRPAARDVGHRPQLRLAPEATRPRGSAARAGRGGRR